MSGVGDPQCGGCVFWRRGLAAAAHDVDVGRCHRYPRTWSKTATDFCGEHLPTDPAEADAGEAADLRAELAALAAAPLQPGPEHLAAAKRRRELERQLAALERQSE